MITIRPSGMNALRPGNSCIPVRIDAQTNPLWSEQKIKNFLPHMTSVALRDLVTRTDTLLIPVPALEQHGLQGPIETDYYAGVEQSKLIVYFEAAQSLIAQGFRRFVLMPVSTDSGIRYVARNADRLTARTTHS